MIVTHLFFADDIAVFGRATPDTCRCIREILLEYCRLSGQEINRDKKSRIIFSRRISEDLKVHLLSILNFRQDTEVGIYLGIPLSSGPLRMAHFGNLQARISRKLALWKAKCLTP